MPRPLALIGGGGHCRSVIDAALSAGMQVSHIVVTPAELGKTVMGPYTGNATDADIPLLATDHDFVVTLGGIKDLTPRKQLHELVKAAGGRFATIVASTAHVSPFATLGEGTVVLHQATVGPAATIGESVIINTSATVEHDATVKAFSHISTGARVNGGACVGGCTTIGSNAVVLQGVTVAAQIVVGAGGVVINDLTEAGVYAGVPVRLIKHAEND